MKKSDLWFGWACDHQKILQKSYEKVKTKLCKTYEKLTTTLQVSYENIKFAASDVIWETLCEAVIGRILWAKNNWQQE